MGTPEFPVVLRADGAQRGCWLCRVRLLQGLGAVLSSSWVEHREPTGCKKPTVEQLPLLYTCKAVLSEIVKLKALWCGCLSLSWFCLRPGAAEVISSAGEISGCCSLMASLCLQITSPPPAHPQSCAEFRDAGSTRSCRGSEGIHCTVHPGRHRAVPLPRQ